MKRILSILLSALLITSLVFALVACVDNSRKKPEQDTSFSVVDTVGRTVNFAKIPAKIISLAPSNTEVVFSVGLGAKVVGVTTYCDFPAAALAIDKIGGYFDPNLEIIISKIGSDKASAVVLASSIHMGAGGVVSSLENLGYKVVVVEPTTFTELFSCMRLVTKVGGGDSLAAEALISALETRINHVTKQISANTPRVTVMHFIFSGYWIAGENSIPNDIIVMAGGTNAGAPFGTTYGQISIENLIGADPYIITMVSDMGTMSEGVILSEITQNPLLRGLDAVRNNRVFIVTQDPISRVTPRTVDSLEEFAKLIHPELFA